MRKLLYPFSFLYAAIMILRNFLYEKGVLRVFKADIPVISVGNISTGGTGKTPLAAYLINHFQASQKLMPSYLSRGYGRKSQGFMKVDPKGESKTFGDEALMIANAFPEIEVVVSESRKKGLEYLQNHADLAILDDAFQHRKVARNLEILSIDANHLPTNDLILPAGNLREPLSGIQRADILIVNKVDSETEINSIKAKLNRFNKPMAFTKPVLAHWLLFNSPNQKPISSLKGKSIWLISGIGNPNAFEKSVGEYGANIIRHFKFKDHYDFQKQDFEKISNEFKRDANPPICLLTTEKDYFRLRDKNWLKDFEELSLAYVKMNLHWWEGEEILLNLLRKFAAPNMV